MTLFRGESDGSDSFVGAVLRRRPDLTDLTDSFSESGPMVR